MNQEMQKESERNEIETELESKQKLTASVHVMCGWPLVLVAIGGAIGGGLGGAAYGINIAIYKSKLPTSAKVILNLAVGLAAIGIWFSIATAL